MSRPREQNQSPAACLFSPPPQPALPLNSAPRTLNNPALVAAAARQHRAGEPQETGHQNKSGTLVQVSERGPNSPRPAGPRKHERSCPPNLGKPGRRSSHCRACATEYTRAVAARRALRIPGRKIPRVLAGSGERQRRAEAEASWACCICGRQRHALMGRPYAREAVPRMLASRTGETPFTSGRSDPSALGRPVARRAENPAWAVQASG